MRKSYSKTGRSCRVTFELPTEVKAQTVSLCGDFNNWDSTKHVMKQRKNGSFSLTISLQSGNEYRFRYLIDENTWENDWSADRYLPNKFGSEDSVIEV